MIGSNAQRLWTGLGMAAAMVATIVLVFLAFNGTFADVMRVRAEISTVGDSLRVGDDVSYRELVIGKVTSFDADGEGGAVLDLTIDDEFAERLPANLSAVGVPSDLFGKTTVLLMEPDEPAGSLAAGDTIPASTSEAAAGLQTALSDVYDLLNEIEPAQLTAALSALDEALAGRGPQLNQLLADSSDYLGTLVDDRERLVRLVDNLSTTIPKIDQASPDLLAATDHLLEPARVVAERRASLDALLDVAPRTADRTTAFTEAIGDDTIVLLEGQRSVLGVLAENPEGLPDSFTGFGDLAQAFNTAIRDGKLHLNAVVSGANAAFLVPLTIPGSKAEVLARTTDPTTYSGADARRSVAASMGADALAVAGDDTAGTSGNVGAASEKDVLRSVTSDLLQLGEDDQLPSAVEVLLGPLLRGSAVTR